MSAPRPAAISPVQPSSAAHIKGRDTELQDLAKGYERAASGETAVFLVHGEPGIGKTTIATAIAESAQDSGASVAWGRCWEGGGAPAYWPWTQVVREILTDTSSLLESLGPGAAAVARLVPEIAGPSREEGDPEAERFALFEAMTRLLEKRGQEQPIVVVLDDLHAADHASVLLLKFIARTSRRGRVLVLGTYRTAEVAADAALASLIDEVAREAKTVALGPLDQESLSAITEDVAGQKPSRTLLESLSEITGGNPFYLTEIIHSLQQEGQLEERLELRRGALSVPSSVNSLLRDRMKDLSPQALEVLEVAATIGQAFDARLLESAVRHKGNGSSIGTILEEASASGIFTSAADERIYSFGHALLREAIYGSLSDTRRRGAHRAIADALEERGDAAERVAELAHHYIACSESPEDEVTAFRYCVQAAERARSALAYEQAAELLEKALERLPGQTPAADRVALLCDLAEMLIYSGHASRGREKAAEAGAAARALADPKLQTRAALTYGILPVEGGIVDGTCVQLLRDALAAIPPDKTPERARLLARLGHELYFSAEPGDADLPERFTGEAVEIMRSFGPSRDKAMVLRARFTAVIGPETWDETLQLANELLALGQELRDPEIQFLAHIRRTVVHSSLGNAAELDAEIESCAGLAARLHRPEFDWMVRVAKACLSTMRDPKDVALAAIEDAFAVGGDTPNAMGAYMLQQALARFESEAWDFVEPIARMVMEQRPGIRRGWRGALVASLVDQGRSTEAITIIREVVGELPEMPRDWMFLSSLTYVARAALAIGHTEGADDIYDALLPFEEQHIAQLMAGPVAYMGSVSFTLGILATALERWDEAEEHYENALAKHASLGAVTYFARTQVELARMLLRKSDPEDLPRIASLLEEARTTARPLGQTRIIDDAEELMAEVTALPENPMPQEVPGDASLTERGEFVSFSYGEEEAQLKMSRGIEWLARLLTHPDQEIHVLDLAGGAPPSQPARMEDSLEIDAGDGAGALLDASAKAAYRKRIEELDADLEEAEAFNDPERAARAREEKQALLDHLAGAIGLGGRDRKSSSNAERARVNVRKRIRGTLDKIEEAAPELGRHLKTTVKTGVFVSYSSELQPTLEWTVKLLKKKK